MARKFQDGPLHEGRNAPPERVIAALDLLGKMRSSEVQKALMEQFGIKDASAKRAMQHARILLSEVEAEKVPYIKATLVARLERIIDKAEDAGDYSAAVRGVRELVGIYGVHKAEEVIVRVNPEVEEQVEALSDEQLAALAAMGPQSTH